MIVISNSVSASIPVIHFFDEFVAECVVAEGEGDVKNRYHISTVDRGVEFIKSTIKNGNVMVVYHENLVRTVDKVLTIVVVLRGEIMTLDLMNVDLGDPRVSIGCSNQYVFRVDVVRFEIDLFEMLHTPRSITGLPLLFVRSQDVSRVIHMEEFVLEHANQLFGLLIRIFLMGLHRQEKCVSLLSPGVLGHLTDSFCKQIDGLFAIGKHEYVNEILR